jgi:ABC-type nickel/cobalt efflux system permease component RcnA
MRHALEPDHLTAVSTLVANERRALRGAWLGAWWGVGHLVSLLVIGSTLAALQTQMPSHLAAAFELAVAAMLIGLGIRSIMRALRDARGCAPGAPASLLEIHDCGRGHIHVGRRGFAIRSLSIGLMHGMAGSGTLVALVAAELPTLPLRIAYILVFGFGAIIGMTLLSGLAGIPLAPLSRSPRLGRVLLAATGSLSIGLGIGWALRMA